jgi:hypothetical protein
MNLLDENIPSDEVELLRAWRLRVSQIGEDLAAAGITDEDIVRLLHRVRGVTFFSRDGGFYDRTLVHSRYCIIVLDVRRDEIARFIRRFLRSPNYRRRADRLGHVFRISHVGVHYWTKYARRESFEAWDE